jgi:hypothetical protein
MDQDPMVSLLALALAKDLQALEKLCIDVKTRRALIQAALVQTGQNEGRMDGSIKVLTHEYSLYLLNKFSDEAEVAA